MEAQFVDPISRNKITIKEAEKLFRDKMNEQMREIKLEGQGQTVAPNLKQQYKEKKELIMNYLEETLAANIASESLAEIMEDLFFTMTQGNQGASSSSSTFKSERQIGSQVGYFFEQGMFGQPKGDDPSADLREVMTELKHVKTGSKYLKVGGITLESFDKNSLLDVEKYDNIMYAYKMYAKMQNLLLLRTHWESKVSGAEGSLRRKVKIDELMLFMDLIFEKLWKVLRKEIKGQLADSVMVNKSGVKETYIDVKPGVRSPGYKIEYDIKLKMTKVRGAYAWADLYLRKVDLLAMIKSDASYRADFFGRVRHLQELRGIKNKILPTR